MSKGLARGEGQVRSRRLEVLWWLPFLGWTRGHLTSMRVVSFSNSRSFGPSSVRSGSLKDPRPHPGRAQVEPRLHEFHDGLVLLRRGRVLVLTQCC